MFKKIVTSFLMLLLFNFAHGALLIDPITGNWVPAELLTGNATGDNPFLQRWYVDAINGNDTNDGKTLETAFRSFDYALLVAKDDDKIFVNPGVYEGNRFISKRLTITALSHNPWTTILRGSGHAPACLSFDSKGSGSVIQGFCIENGAAAESFNTPEGKKIDTAASIGFYGTNCVKFVDNTDFHFIIKDCIITDTNVQYTYGIDTRNCNVYLYNCLFTKNNNRYSEILHAPIKSIDNALVMLEFCSIDDNNGYCYFDCQKILSEYFGCIEIFSSILPNSITKYSHIGSYVERVSTINCCEKSSACISNSFIGAGISLFDSSNFYDYGSNFYDYGNNFYNINDFIVSFTEIGFSINRVEKNSFVTYDGIWRPGEEIPPVEPDPVIVTNIVTETIPVYLTNTVYEQVFVTNTIVQNVVNVSNIVNYVERTNTVDLINNIFVTNTVVNISNIVNSIDLYTTNIVVETLTNIVQNTVSVTNFVAEVLTNTVYETFTTTNVVDISSAENIACSNIGFDPEKNPLMPGFDGATAMKHAGMVVDTNMVVCGIMTASSSKKNSKGVSASGKIYLKDGKAYSVSSKNGVLENGIATYESKAGNLGEIKYSIGKNGIYGECGSLKIYPMNFDDGIGIVSGSIQFKYINDKNTLTTRTMKINGMAVDGDILFEASDKNQSFRVYGETLK